MEYVWYACYGSNLNYERFMRYINGCDDRTPPVESRPFRFPHSIYFAKESKVWTGGKAFLDVESEGMAYGRIYRVTREQYRQIKAAEGVDYRKQLDLGTIDRFPVYSFTDMQTNREVQVPSHRYFQTILNGLKECYGGTIREEELTDYLVERVMPASCLAAACAVGKRRSALTIEEIAESTDCQVAEAESAVHWLVEKGVLREEKVLEDVVYALTEPADERRLNGKELVEALLAAKE